MNHKIKKISIAALSMVMMLGHVTGVLAGEKTVYPKDQDGRIYAGEESFVSENVLSVGFQTTPRANGELPDTISFRMVTTVDSLKYDCVGFDILTTNLNTGASRLSTTTATTVYKKIKISDSEVPEYGITPDYFDSSSRYFATYVIKGIPRSVIANYSFTVTPFWEINGYKVSGVTRSMRMDDAYQERRVANVPVRLSSNMKVAAGYVEVAYDSSIWEFAGKLADAKCLSDGIFEEIEVYEKTPGVIRIAGNVEDITKNTLADGMLVNLRFQTKAVEMTWPNTAFAVCNSTTAFVNISEETVDVPVVQAKYYTFTK